MKISSISLTNFAHYTHVTASFDPNVTYLIGKNGAGKSTIGITGVQAIMQGIAEKASTATPNPLYGERFRFIGPNGTAAKMVMELYDGNNKITVTRKLTKTGSELSFTAPDGMVLTQKWLTDLFNVYLIAPKRFLALTGKEQAQVLGIDTTTYDAELLTLKQQATNINRDIKSYGEIAPVMEVQAVDMAALEARKQAIRAELNSQYVKNKQHNEELRKAWQVECEKERQRVEQQNKEQDKKKSDIDFVTSYRKRIEVILAEVIGLDKLVDITKLNDHIARFPQPDVYEVYVQPAEPAYIPELPDNAALVAIEAEISAAAETNLAAYKYTEYLKRVEGRNALQQELETNKDLQFVAKNKRTNYLQSFELPFDGLEISDDGDLLLNGKPLCEPYFSTGELLKIVPIMLSVTNPELKYVFIQDFNLLDEDAQREVEAYLVERGFQLVVELVGKAPIVDKNCIVLSDNIQTN